MCIRHGAVKEYKRCLVGGCKSRPVGKERVCARHVGVSLVDGGGKLYNALMYGDMLSIMLL